MSESPEFGARWIQMSWLAPGNPEVRVGAVVAKDRAGDSYTLSQDPKEVNCWLRHRM